LTQRPKALTVTKNAEQGYQVFTGGGLDSPVMQDDGTLYSRNDDAFFSHPWSRYRYDASADHLHLITAADEQHPQRYERSR
ncbi:MAG TPA: hypothetical protein VD886_09865, partial [Herpetosiphonaceae bacterium]|nr:hypothetical protein [Herpetosiphonaceae bacterium]